MTMPLHEDQATTDTRTNRRRALRLSGALPRLLPFYGAAADRLLNSLVDFSKRSFAQLTGHTKRRPPRWTNRLAFAEPLEDRRLLALISTIVVQEQTDDLAYSPVTGKYWATAPATNEIIRIDPTDPNPATQIEQRFFVGSMGVSANPNQIAVSQDGTRAWVGLNGANRIALVDIEMLSPNFGTVLATIPLGADIARDLEVVPGQNDSVAVARFDPAVGNPSSGVTIFDVSMAGAVTQRANGLATETYIEFRDDGTELYGFFDQQLTMPPAMTDFDISRFPVNASGISPATDSANGLVNASGNMEYDSGQLFFDDGSIVAISDPTGAGTITKTGTLQDAGGMAFNAPQTPEDSAQKSYFLVGTGISVADHFTLLQTYNVNIPQASGQGFDPIRFGIDGLGYRTADQVIFVRDDQFGFKVQAPLNQTNTIRVVRNGADIEVYINAMLRHSLDYATNQGIRICGGDQGDTLIVDHSGGDVLQGVGIVFDADPNGTGGAGLVRLEGDAADDVLIAPTVTPGGGRFTVFGANAGSIAYADATALEVDTVDELTYQTAGAADNLTVNNPAAATLRVSGTSGGASIDPLTFSNVRDFDLDADAGGPDMIDVNAANSGLGPLEIFTIRTGNGNDSLTVDLPFDLTGASNFSWLFGGGDNSVTVNTPAGQSNTIDVFDTRIVTTNPVQETINFTGSGNIAVIVNANDAVDTINVDDAFGAGDSITVNAGAGDDMVNFGATFVSGAAVAVNGSTGVDTISLDGDYNAANTVTVNGGDDNDVIDLIGDFSATGTVNINGDAGMDMLTFNGQGGPVTLLNVNGGAEDDMIEVHLSPTTPTALITVEGGGGTDSFELAGAVGINDRLEVTNKTPTSGDIVETVSGTPVEFGNIVGDLIVSGQVGEDDRLTVNARDDINDIIEVRPDTTHQGVVTITTTAVVPVPTLKPTFFDDIAVLIVNAGDEMAGGDLITVQPVGIDIPITVNGGQPGNEVLPLGDQLIIDRTGVTTATVMFTSPGNGTVTVNGTILIPFTSIEGNPLCQPIVTNILDSAAGSPTIVGSLRAALECIAGFPGLAITFEIPGAGPHTIMPQYQLPSIMDKVILDGTSQEGFVDAPIIEIDGSLAGPTANGLEIRGGDPSVIQGVVVNNFGNVGLVVSGTDGHTIDGNYFGTDLTGTMAKPNGTGIVVQSANNTIGTAAAGNLISGNSLAGVRLSGLGATGNNVWNNKIGTDLDGTTALGNSIGVEIVAGQDNHVGGTADGQDNLISGNALYGVWLRASDNNVVQGNFIGTNMSADAAVPNREGVLITASAGNRIGGAADGAGNLISGNFEAGVWLSGTRADGNFVEGNVIGLNAAGDAALGNRDGVDIDRAPNNMIGGIAEGAANVISGNSRNGVVIKGVGATGNVLLENLIGTNADGSAALGNRRGILIDNAPGNQIGDAPAGQLTASGNLISGNVTDGVRLQGADATGNMIQSNRIGTDLGGTKRLPNNIGIQIRDDADGNLIGGDSTLKLGNLISANFRHGLALKDVDDNLIYGNLIGTSLDGTAALGHTQDGVRIKKSNNSPKGENNLIGGGGQGQGNVIADSGEYGVRLGTDNNTVQGNHIGTNITGTRALPNRVGVVLVGSGNVIGGDSRAREGNLISGNVEEGVLIERTAATGNLVQGNLIGSNVSGAEPMPNENGVSISLGAHDNLIGGDSSAGFGNTISGNNLHGVYIKDVGTTGNRVEGNNIGINRFAFAALPNGKQGVLIDNADSNVIGGSTPGTGNLIAGNTFDGVKIGGVPAMNNKVQGNVIGRLGIPNRNGVLISDFAADNLIGGTGTGESNTIAHNSEHGVWINAKGRDGNAVRRNAIYNNGGTAFLGLDLSISGQNKNDTNDVDRGPNKTQNYPEILSVIRQAATLDITFLVDSAPGTAVNRSNYGVNGLEIEFYVSDSDAQEGETFLSQSFYPEASARLPFTVTIPAGPAGVGATIVATATDADANTSEFSDPKAVTMNLLAADGPVSGTAAALEAGQLAPIVDLAIARLESFGFAADRFATVDVTIADLPGAELGLASATSITIDVDAAGHGWFVSPESRVQRLEPEDSDAYSGSGLSTLDSPLHIDLLTVVMHELGHVAGLDDLYDPAAEEDVMYALLRPGVRKTLTDASLAAAEVDLVFHDYE